MAKKSPAITPSSSCTIKPPAPANVQWNPGTPKISDKLRLVPGPVGPDPAPDPQAQPVPPKADRHVVDPAPPPKQPVVY